jgi:hypothetical protein
MSRGRSTRLVPTRSAAAYPTHAEVGPDRRTFLRGLGVLALATGLGACKDGGELGGVPGDAGWPPDGRVGTEGQIDAGSRDVGLQDRLYPTEGDLPVWDVPPPDADTDALPPDAGPGDAATDATAPDADPGEDAAGTDDASIQHVHR